MSEIEKEIEKKALELYPDDDQGCERLVFVRACYWAIKREKERTIKALSEWPYIDFTLDGVRKIINGDGAC